MNHVDTIVTILITIIILCTAVLVIDLIFSQKIVLDEKIDCYDNKNNKIMGAQCEKSVICGPILGIFDKNCREALEK